MKRGTIVLILVAAALVAVPFVIRNELYLNLASQILIYALLAVSLNLLLGYGGMVSLGHASFLGLTSYAAVLLLNAGFGELNVVAADHGCLLPGARQHVRRDVCSDIADLLAPA